MNARKKAQRPEEMLSPRDAALQLRISFPTIKQWIYAARFAASERRVAIIGSRRRKSIDCYIARGDTMRRSGRM